MNFERFKSRVTAAADVAKQFKGFDEMASQDEYIHSPDLNVRQNRRPRPVEREPTTEQTRGSLEEANAVINSMPSSGMSRPTDVDNAPSPATFQNGRQEEEKRNVALLQKTRMPLLSVVSDLVSEKSSEAKSDQESLSRSSLTNSSPFPEAEDSSSDDDSFHDAVRDDFIRGVNQRQENEEASTYGRSRSNVEDRQGNPNRFMEDLDRRMSMPPDIEMVNVHSTATNNTDNERPLPASFSESENKWDWMRNAASTRVNRMLSLRSSESQVESSQQEREALTRNEKHYRQPRDSHDEFSVTTSSSVLGAEEQAQLQRIRMATQAHPLTFVLNAAMQNPQFFFIAFTIVLGTAVYFYARRRGSEDGLS